MEEQPQCEWISVGVNIHKDDWGLKFVILEPCAQHEKSKPQQRLALLSDAFSVFESFLVLIPPGLSHDIFPWLIL